MEGRPPGVVDHGVDEVAGREAVGHGEGEAVVTQAPPLGPRQQLRVLGRSAAV
jgi:hypothetical protein